LPDIVKDAAAEIERLRADERSALIDAHHVLTSEDK
jgi:hypothetical protein